MKHFQNEHFLFHHVGITSANLAILTKAASYILVNEGFQSVDAQILSYLS